MSKQLFNSLSFLFHLKIPRKSKMPSKLRHVFVENTTEKMGLTFLFQGNPVVVKRVEKDQVDLTRTVLLELKQVSS